MREPSSHDSGQRGAPAGAGAAPVAHGGGTQRQPLPRWRAVLAGLIAILGVAMLLWVREPVSDWLWPDTQVQQLREEAELALRNGVLTQSDGRGARELFEAAIALDPDRPETRYGLILVGQAALAQADAAISEERFSDAHAALALARELAVPRAQTEAVAVRLRRNEIGGTGVALLLNQAAAARGNGRLDGAEDAALPLYESILVLQPNHTQALEGREDTLADLLQLSRQALGRGDLAEAKRLNDRVQAVDPGHVGLPDALAEFSDTVRERLREADADLRRGRLSRALAQYDAVAEIDPDNEHAQQGRIRVANAHAEISERHAADFRFVQAVAALQDARAIAPDAPAVTAASQHLARARQLRATLDSATPSAERRRRVQRLLQEAAVAQSRGDLLSPPGASAFDKVRAARALAPDDKAVEAAAARLLPAAQSCFEQALRGNRLSAAGACLDALEAMSADSSSVSRDARTRLAQRWIAVGDERLGAGELRAARNALDAARKLDPQVDGLAEFSTRVRKAAAAQ